jgi:Arc/MetJ-type ribon-helix-helix transcriptional regulator
MTKQIAVKLPEPLLAHVDELVAEGTFKSRSDLVRRGIEAVIASRRRREADEAFRLGYERHPEDAGELAEAERLALEAIQEEPWERWW